MQRRAVRLLEIRVTLGVLQLPPRFAAGMAIRADIAASHPPVIETIVIGTELMSGIDCASASSRAQKQGWRGGGCLRAGLDDMLTRVTVWLMDEAREGFRVTRALRDGRGGGGWDPVYRGLSPSPCPIQEQTEP